MADYEKQCKVTFPGVTIFDSAEFTDSCGIAPGTGRITIIPQLGLPTLEGDLVFTQGGFKVPIKNCRIVESQVQRNSQGQIVSLMIQDERWKWVNDYAISGRYNMRLGDNKVDPLYEKKPIELVEMLFAAMGVTNYDASIVKSDPDVSGTRPSVDWDVAIPSHELQSLLSGWGLILCPDRAKGIFRISRIGEGRLLPLTYPYADLSEGIDPAESPEAYRVYGSPIRHQFRFELEPVGKEIIDSANQPSPVPDDPKEPRPTNNADGSFKPIDQLTYAPKDASGNVTWQNESEEFENVSIDRVVQPDGTYAVAQDLARQYVYRAYRPLLDTIEGRQVIAVPGYKNPKTDDSYVTRAQLILSSELVDTFIDPDGVKRQKPAFCDFVGTHDLLPEQSVNTLGGTRLDIESSLSGYDASSVVTFSVDVSEPTSNPTSSAGLVTFSRQLRRFGDDPNDGPVLPARAWMTCYVTILDPETNQPIRYQRTMVVPGVKIPDGQQPKRIRIVRQDDIQQWFKTDYLLFDDGEVRAESLSSNTEECDRQADYYLNAKLKELDTTRSQQITYLFLNDAVILDGAIRQLTYSVSASGCQTRASRNSEHNPNVPTFKERTAIIQRNEVAREKEIADKQALKRVRK